MSNASDFIIENGVLTKYVGPGGDVNIPEGITEIGFEAFAMSDIKKVILPSTLKVIGEMAFMNCENLVEVVIPDSVIEILGDAFNMCKNLKVVPPMGLELLGDRAFAGTATSHIVITNDKMSIGKNVFGNCQNLKTAGPLGGGYDLEYAWTEEIPAYAFSNMRSLNKAVLPDSVKKIGDNAFKNCKALSDLTMPQSAQVAKNTFNGCVNLGGITYTDAETPASAATKEKPVKTKKSAKPEFAVANGVLIKYNGRDANVVIPEGIVTIGRRAFYNNKDIVSVVIPEGVETIEQEAFDWCSKLETISLSNTVTKIGSNAFEFDLLKKIISVAPLRLFTKAGLYDAVSTFSFCFSAMDKSTDVYKENLAYIGANLKAQNKYNRAVYELLMRNASLRHAVFEIKAISVKDADWFFEQLNQEEDTAIIAELLEYKNTLLQDPKAQKKQAAAKKREQDKALASKMTPAEWKKIFRFSYINGDIIIKETKVWNEVVTVPSYIGTKKVRILDFDALFFSRWKALDTISPKTVIISEGIEEIRSVAIRCVEDADIYIPSTVTFLPDHAFVACRGITLHFPLTLTDISNNIFDDCLITAICAPAGSYAETYAKKKKIPFVAE